MSITKSKLLYQFKAICSTELEKIIEAYKSNKNLEEVYKIIRKMADDEEDICEKLEQTEGIWDMLEYLVEE